MSDPNYENIDLDKFRDKNNELSQNKLKEADTTERRAYLYHVYTKNGYLPRQQNEYASLFGVASSRISVDLKKIRKYIANNIDSEKARSDIDLFGDAIKKKLIEKGELYKAWKVVSQKTEMLQELGEVEKAPDKHKLEGSGEFLINIVEREQETKEESDD